MSSMKKFAVALGATVSLLALNAGSANATNGMLPHCIGTTKCGKGGSGSARGEAAVDAALNPALAADMGNQYQVNLGMFWAKVRGQSNFSTIKGEQKSAADFFPTGGLGVNYILNDKMNFNLSIVPGGGGASDWTNSRSDGAGAGGTASDDQEVTYEMLYLQPSLSYKFSDTASYGIGAIISRATMTTDSVQGSFAPSGVQDTDETFYGFGFQIGGAWQPTDTSSFALSLRSPVWHQDTGVYDGVVFTDPIDTPAQALVGLTIDASESTTLSVDYKWVNWSGVNTIGNDPYGTPTSSRGFGWVDQHIIMLGIEHDVNDALTLRAGLNHGNSPIPENAVLANFLFPAIVEDHFTAGGDYGLGNGMVLGVSGYVTPEAEFYDDGAGNTNATGSHLGHRQYGFQLSFSQEF